MTASTPPHWRRELLVLTVLVLAAGAIAAIPSVMRGFEGHFPDSLLCAELQDVTLRTELEGRFERRAREG